MKATIDFDETLYRQLKIEAARRGRTLRELVAEGVRHVLDTPPAPETPDPRSSSRPEWFGALARYGQAVNAHDMTSVRESVARGRARRP